MRISICLICLFSFLTGFTQEYNFSRLTEEDGLPGNRASCFLKDSEGFIWIGTASGLCRYDGYTIKQFTTDFGYDISDEIINTIIQDKDDMIWIGTNSGGLNRLDPKTEKIVTFRHDPKDPSSIAGDRIRELIEGDDGVIWIAFDNGIGLSKFDKHTGKSVNYNPFATISAAGVKAIRSMVLDSRNPGTLWLGTTSGLIRFDIESESFEVIDHPLSAIDRYGLFALDQVDENRLLAGFFHAGIDIYNLKEKKWDEVYDDPVHQNRIFDLSRKSENEFWVAARKKGLAVYNTDLRELTFVPSDINNQSTPFPGFTTSVYSEGDRVWIGGKYGVSYSNTKRLTFPFDSVSHPKTEAGQIIEISGKYDKIYFLEFPFHGLIQLDKNTGQEVIHLKEKNLVFHDMLELEDVIYFYERNRDLYIFDKETATLSLLPTPLVKERKLAVSGIKEWNSTHAILLTSYGGAWKLAYETNEITPLVNHENNDEWQQDLLLHEDGTIWIGGTKGIVIYNPSTNEVSKLPLSVIESEKEKHVHALAKGLDGVIWIGTTRGLVKLEGEKETLYNVKNSDLAGNIIYQIVIDLSGHLWLKTQKGLSKVIPSEMEIVNYDRSDGIDSEGKLSSIEGEIYYGTYGGYFKLNKQAVGEEQHPPNVHLLTFQVANQDFKMEKNINYTKEIHLKYWENSFSLTFSSPNFEKPEKIQYAYRLNGLEEEWISNQERRFVNYTNMDGGTYTFQVRARISEGEWGVAKSVDIHLASPFWETWWFYLACGIVVFGSGFFIYTLRIRAIQKTADLAAQELQIEALKNRFTELHSSPSQLAVQLNLKELNQKLNNQLTLREFEVLKLSLEGKTNSEISDSLSISVSTVKFHLRNTYSKMGVGNRKEAFQYMLNT